MGNKRLKKKIEGLKRQIIKHEEKIRIEKLKDFPDDGMIRHWQVEIDTFRRGIEKVRRRLNK